jgi:capsular polysaccharide biosynthesis protein
MSQQTLDLRGFLQTVRRYRLLVGLTAAAGLTAGAAYTVLHPPMLSSRALVVLPATVKDTGTQVVIAASDPVLSSAGRSAGLGLPLATLRTRVHVSSLTPTVVAINGQGSTAAQAEQIANAVAGSYVAYISDSDNPGVQASGRVLERAGTASGSSLPARVLVTGLLGALAGSLAGSVGAVASARRDPKLRLRDDIADAIGVPVLASLPVTRPSDAGGWTRLLDSYQPGVVHAWGLRKALHHLGLPEAKADGGACLTVLSLAADTRALAVGPQLAVFAASLGIPATLAIGPQQDENATATLRAACAARSGPAPRTTAQLRTAVGETVGDEAGALHGAGLTVAVAALDGEAPQLPGLPGTAATVLAVSAGGATAEQLARVAICAATRGRDIAGIIVADPDPQDHTTGRVPDLSRPARPRPPTKLTSVTETRR